MHPAASTAPSGEPPPGAPRERTAPRLPEPEGELARVARALRERPLVALLVCVLGGALFHAWAARQTPVYQATATVLVEAAPPQILGAEVRDVVQVGPGQYWQMQDYLQTERRVLTSDRMARRLVARLRLDRDARFFPAGLPKDAAQAAEWAIASVSAEVLPDTQILAVTVRHGDPAQARRAADGLVDAFIDDNEAFRDAGNTSASIWLAAQSDDLRKRLEASELALYEWKRANDLLSVSLEERSGNLGRQIEKLSDALTDVRLRRVARAAEAEELESMSADPAGASPAASSPALEALRAQLLDEERKLSELSTRYEEPHPQVRQQAAKVKSVQAGITREVMRLLGGARARTREAETEERRIAAELEAAKQEGLRMTRLEVDYNKLKREAESAGKQYLLVENRTKETQLAGKVKLNNLHVLDYARLPTAPSSPHLVRAALAFAAATLLLALLAPLALLSLDRTVKTERDVATTLGLPLLGLMPRFPRRGAPERLAHDEPMSPLAECCRVVRTNLSYAGLARPLARLLVTSPLAREGKTVLAANLAIASAQAGGRVLLVDADLRRPRLGAALGLPREVGITDVLLGHATLDEAIQPTAIPNLFALLSGGAPPSPSEILESPRFRELLDACSARFDRVLLDSAPLLPVADSAILARACDGVALVVRSGRTGRAEARRASQVLADVGARVVGVVLNDCGGAVAPGYGYGYGARGRTKPRATDGARRAA